MPVDLPPPVLITAPLTKAPPTVHGEVYGPIDKEAAPRDQGGAQECPEGKPDEIVVCADVADDQQYRIGPLAPPPKTAMEEVSDALRFRHGKLEYGLIAPGQVGIRIRF